MAATSARSSLWRTTQAALYVETPWLRGRLVGNYAVGKLESGMHVATPMAAGAAAVRWRPKAGSVIPKTLYPPHRSEAKAVGLRARR